MPELRWILLGVGVVFCLGLWWWETRRRGRRADALRRAESSRAAEPAHDFESRFDDDAFDEPTINRIEGRIEPTFDGATPVAERVEPALDDEPALETEPQSEPEAEPAEAPARTPQEQKIVSLRVTAAPDRLFVGRELREALQGAGLTHGKFSIFHRQGGDGGAVFSVASLTEPGTFDLQSMDGQQFRGITFFAVHQEAGDEGIADMRRCAQGIADRLRGQLSGGR